MNMEEFETEQSERHAASSRVPFPEREPAAWITSAKTHPVRPAALATRGVIPHFDY